VIALRTADADALLGSIFRDAFEPRPAPDPVEWAEREWVLPDKGTGVRGRIDLSRTPAAIQVLETMVDPTYDQVTLRKATQLFGSTILLVAMGYKVPHDPGDVLYVIGNETKAQELNEKRFTPAVRKSPTLRRHWSGRPQDLQRLKVQLDAMDVTFTGAGSEANLETSSLSWVIVDELDRCEEKRPNIIEFVRKRIENSPSGKIIVIGRPGMKGEGIDLAYCGDADPDGQPASDRRRFHVPCPHCGRFHVRRWKQVFWDAPESGRTVEASPELIAATARMACPDCGAEILAADNLAQQRMGVWIREGEAIESDGRIAGKLHDRFVRPLSRYRFDELREDGPERERAAVELGVVIDTNNLPRSAHAGFELSGLYRTLDKDQNPYASVAVPFRRNGCIATPDWTQSDLGEAWEPAGEGVALEEIKRARVPVSGGGSRLTAPPVWVRAIITAVDLQKSYARVVSYGFGEHARDVAVIDFETVPIPGDGDFAGLDRFLAETGYTRRGGQPVPVLGFAIDTGFWTDQAIGLCQRLRAYGKLVIPVKGAGNANITGPYREVPLGRTSKTLRWARAAGLNLLSINTDHWKPVVLGRLRGELYRLKTSGAERDEVPRMALAEDAPDQLLRELTAEQLVRIEHKRGKKAGRSEHVWMLRPGEKDNHALDTAVYALAAADRLNLAARLRPVSEEPAPRREPEPRPRRRSVSVEAVRRQGLRRADRRTLYER